MLLAKKDLSRYVLEYNCKKEWSKGFTKDKVRIMVRMLKSDALTNSGIFEEVTMDETAWENNKIVMIMDPDFTPIMHWWESQSTENREARKK